MTQPTRAIYLPPGVVPPQPAPPVVAVNPGIPFDRQFFEKVLGGAVKAFCEQANCGSPIVELLTVDGTRHFIKGISGVSDAWVALHTQSEDHEHPIQVFLPFGTIYRVEIHAENDVRQGRLGFLLPTAHEAPIIIPAEATEVGKKAPSKGRASRSRSKSKS